VLGVYQVSVFVRFFMRAAFIALTSSTTVCKNTLFSLFFRSMKHYSFSIALMEVKISFIVSSSNRTIKDAATTEN
jgi:hypothetical protein